MKKKKRKKNWRKKPKGKDKRKKRKRKDQRKKQKRKDQKKRKIFGIKNVVGIPNDTIKSICNSSNNEQINSDVNIRLSIKNISIFDTSKPKYLANRGYQIVLRNINKIKEMLEYK